MISPGKNPLKSPPSLGPLPKVEHFYWILFESTTYIKYVIITKKGNSKEQKIDYFKLWSIILEAPNYSPYPQHYKRILKDIKGSTMQTLKYKALPRLYQGLLYVPLEHHRKQVDYHDFQPQRWCLKPSQKDQKGHSSQTLLIILHIPLFIIARHCSWVKMGCSNVGIPLVACGSLFYLFQRVRIPPANHFP